MRAFIRQLVPALLALTVFTLVVGVVYPLVTTAVAQVAFPDEADGSLIERDGEVVGSRLVGQPFVSDVYFHSRPSAAGSGYDAAASSGSNLGPLDPVLLDLVSERIADYRTINGLDGSVRVPVDAVTASGSGLDPHISIANARLQTARVAATRGLEPAVVEELVDDHTVGPDVLVLGEPAVDVVSLNLVLDDLAATPSGS